MKERKSEQSRQRNALKHGAFTAELLIHEEDGHEFEELHNGIREDLKPSGRMEDESVRDIAKLCWRKRRIERFYVHEAGLILLEHSGGKELEAAELVNSVINTQLSCTDVWDELLPVLPEHYYEQVKGAIDRPSADSGPDWIADLKEFINELILTARSAISHRRSSIAFAGETAAKLGELSAKCLALEERLDAMIDKSFKRYAQIKTFKEILAFKDRAAPHKISVN